MLLNIILKALLVFMLMCIIGLGIGIVCIIVIGLEETFGLTIFRRK